VARFGSLIDHAGERSAIFWRLLAPLGEPAPVVPLSGEARGDNADLNFTASSCSAFFAYLHHSSAREDSESGVQANG
jgi:hypothetical protein